MLLGRVGVDEAGDQVRRLASEKGITTCLPGWPYPTITDQRIVNDGYLRFYEPATHHTVSDPQILVSGLHGIPADQVERIRLVVIVDRNNGTMSPELVQAVQGWATQHRVPVLVMAHSATMWMYHNVSLLLADLPSAMAMLPGVVHPGLAASMDAETRGGTACQQLRIKYQVPLIVVASGLDSVHYTDPDNDSRVMTWSCPSPTSFGASPKAKRAMDSLLAALAVGVMEERSFSRAVSFALDVAASPVIDRDVVDQRIYKQGGWAAKLMTTDEVIAFAARRRREEPNLPLVLVVGGFDGFNARHLEALRFAATQGDTVIVAYRDDNAMAWANPGSPAVPDSYRASHLALQQSVSAVVRTGYDTSRLVRQLKPDVLVTGVDAGFQMIPGQEFVAQHGGRVVPCPRAPFRLTAEGANVAVASNAE